VHVGRQRGAVRPPCDELVGRLRGVEGVPEEVLVPVGARCLERQARGLPVVPADPAAPAGGDRDAVRPGRPEDVLEDSIEVDVGEVRPRQRVELVDQRDELLVEEIDGVVDLTHAGGAVRAALRELVGAAPARVLHVLGRFDSRICPRDLLHRLIGCQGSPGLFLHRAEPAGRGGDASLLVPAVRSTFSPMAPAEVTFSTLFSPVRLNTIEWRRRSSMPPLKSFYCTPAVNCASTVGF
jgi:hypothetical protein